MKGRVSSERILENEQRFRRANEEISSAAKGLAFPGRVPFLCECDDPNCTAFVPLALSTYREIRAHPNRFFVLPDHEQRAVETDTEAVVGVIEDAAVIVENTVDS